MIFSYLLNMQSHPSWVCGLKLSDAPEDMMEGTVTPFVGVWIETFLAYFLGSDCNSHTLRGCVD